MYGVENHVMGIMINVTDTFFSLSDEEIMRMVAADKESLLFLGEDMLGEGKPEMEYIKAAVKYRNIEKHHVSNIFSKMMQRDNWIKVFDGMIVGKSEIIPEEDVKYIIVGVHTHDVLVGLGMDRKKFATWFADHATTYGIQISEADVKYYHLGPFI